MFFPKIKILFIFVSITVLIGCASKVEQGRILNIEVKPQMAKAWINLMPGTSKPTFNLIGEVEIKNKSDVTISDLTVRKITILQNNSKLFDFQPDFNEVNLSPIIDFIPGKVRIYAFKTKKGIVDFDNLNPNINISFDIEFTSDGGKFIKRINNIKVNKVY